MFVDMLVELLAFWLVVVVVVSIFDMVIRPTLGGFRFSSRVLDVVVLALVLTLALYFIRHMGYFVH